MVFRLFSVVFCAALLSGAAEWNILLPPSPALTEQTAAQELSHYLGAAVKDTLSVDGVQIRNLKIAIDPALPREAWHVASAGDTLIFSGGFRGILYAVYDFLEWQIGIHWWNPFEEQIPPARDITLPRLEISGQPKFSMREIFRSNYPADEGRFAARSRLNRDHAINMHTFSMRYGGTFNYGSPDFSHTFDRIIPAKTFLSTHPEFFSLFDQERRGGQVIGQLCLTNPEMKKEFLKNLLGFIRDDRDYADRYKLEYPAIYEVSENDNPRFCQCPLCQAEVDRYGRNGYLLNFVNDIAGQVAVTYPELWISTFAYSDRNPPRGGIRPADNVIVRLCNTHTSYIAPISSEHSAEYRQQLEDWAKIARQLYIWDYGVTYSRPDLAYANEYTFQERFRKYRECNVTGIFWEHEYPFAGDMYDYKVWLEAKFIENPDYDFDLLSNTFLNGYYGAAGPFIRQYRELLRDAAFAAPEFPLITMSCRQKQTDFIDLQTAVRALAMFEQAEAAVREDPVKLLRTQFARLTLDRTVFLLSELHHRQKAPGEPYPIDLKAIHQKMSGYWKASLKNLIPSQWGDRMSGLVDMELSLFAAITAKKFSPPAKFAGMEHFDFTADTWRLEGPERMSFVEDSESEVGIAVRVDADKSELYQMPMLFGVYDLEKAKVTASIILNELPEQRGYNWFCIGISPVQSFGHIYCTRSWEVQGWFTALDDQKFNAEAWVSAKFAGPLFYKDSPPGPSSIFIDRMVLVKTDKEPATLDCSAQLAEAENLRANGNSPESRKILLEMAENPSLAEAFRQKALNQYLEQTLHLPGFRDGNRRQFEKALRLSADNAYEAGRTIFLKATFESDASQWKETAECAELISRIAAAHPEHQYHVFLMAGRAHLQLKQNAEAKKSFSQALEAAARITYPFDASAAKQELDRL